MGSDALSTFPYTPLRPEITAWTAGFLPFAEGAGANGISAEEPLAAGVTMAADAVKAAFDLLQEPVDELVDFPHWREQNGITMRRLC